MIKKHQPLILVTISFIAGIMMHSFVSFSFGILVALSVIFLILSLLVRREMFSMILLCGCILCCGALYMKVSNVLAKDHVSHIGKYYPRKPVLIEGLIVTDVEQRSAFKGTKTTFYLEVKRFKTKWGWKKKSGKILINLFREEDLFYGDFIQIEGRLHRPFEFASSSNFSYQEFLKRKGITHILSVKSSGFLEIKSRRGGNALKYFSLKVKHRLKQVLNQALSKNESAIMRAILLGDRGDIPKHVKELFQLSGVAHVLAISGLHIGIVSFLFFVILRMLPLSRKWQYAITIVLLIFYAFLTGARTSVIRSTIMASVIIMSLIFERDTDVFNVLSFAALVILLINPNTLYDVGFQLSFVSVFSIIVWYPKISIFLKALVRNHKSRFLNYLIQSISVSTAAYLGVLGLIVYYFQIITPISVFANIIVIPLIAIIVSLGMGLMIFGLIIPAVIPAFAVCIKLLLNLMVAFIFLCVKVPGAYFKVEQISILLVVFYYALVLLGIWGIKRSSKKKNKIFAVNDCK